MNTEFLSNPSVIWLIVGFVLIILELIVPGLILLFFGVGAWIVALLTLFMDLNLNWQIVVFVITSGLSLALLRRYLQTKFFKTKDGKSDGLEDEFIGHVVSVIDEITPNNEGKVEFKGSPWKAKSEFKLVPGDKAEIIDKESITLIVKPK